LVAVGADYNLLLISRIRDESPHGVRSGVIRTVGSTGGVITSAGLIFAASMFGLTFASISTMVQIGFIIGIGILLDTFLVRTITVPAVAALVGRANWWPSRFRPQVRKPVRRAEPVPTSQSGRLTSDHRGQHTRVALPSGVVNRHRHPAHEAHEGPHALPLFGTTTVPEQLATNGPAVEDQMAANGEHLAPANGERPADTDHEEPTQNNGKSTVETNGESDRATNGQHPGDTNGEEPVEERRLSPCERWRCLGTSPYECASEITCLRTRPVEPIVQADTGYEQPAQTNGQSPIETNGEQPVATNGRHSAETSGEEPVETNGEQPAATNDKQPLGTIGRHRADSNGAEPVTTPPVDASSEDGQVNEPPWIGRWPANDATFPVGAHNGHQPATTPPVTPCPRLIGSADMSEVPPMKFAMAAHGTRGEVEPCAAVGLELRRRGHDVRMAVPPNLVGFVESAGLAAVAYGPDSEAQLEEDFFHDFWKIQNPMSLVCKGVDYLAQGWAEMGTTLTSLAEGADLVLTGQTYQAVAANVAEYYDIPFAALHYLPQQVSGHLIPFVPSPLMRGAISAIWWLHWRMTKRVDDAQRRELGLPKATGSTIRRNVERGSLEIQAYDELFFPGLAAEWGGRRPLSGN
jgi:hypothetical protein